MDLAEARLDKTIIGEANLADDSLVGATLSGASLVGADLTGASLAGASLDKADLFEATLSVANLGTILWLCYFSPIGLPRTGARPRTRSIMTRMSGSRAQS